MYSTSMYVVQYIHTYIALTLHYRYGIGFRSLAKVQAVVVASTAPFILLVSLRQWSENHVCSLSESNISRVDGWLLEIHTAAKSAAETAAIYEGRQGTRKFARAEIEERGAAGRRAYVYNEPIRRSGVSTGPPWNHLVLSFLEFA